MWTSTCMCSGREAPVRSVPVPDDIGENPHVAVSRKCWLRVLDVPPLRRLDKLNKESPFCFRMKTVT